LMNITPVEVRVALVENGVLQEIFIERESNRGLVGNIYLGKVVRILPGMQAAFIDIGMERASYLHVRDIYQPENIPESDQAPERPASGKQEPDIRSLLREGESILVQVIKDPLGTKGAKLSSFLSISTRNLVYMPQADHIGISSKIENTEVRERLKKQLIESLASERDKNNQIASTGYIIRTAVEGSENESFKQDIRYLHRLWAALQRRIDRQDSPSLIYTELDVTERVLRDYIYCELERVRVDNLQVYQRLCEFSEEFVPDYKGKIEFYQAERPIFDLFSVEEEVTKALSRKVDLKSGGYLIFDQTEAMTTVDVNTGAFVGTRNQEETIYRTNLEAATMLARQLRLRNLGGIIIVDFIDMKSEEHRRQVLRALEKAIVQDRAKIYMSSFSELGLIEMTRMRTRESLEHILCETCPVCNARGTLHSPATVCAEIFREILRAARAYDNEKLLVIASQPIVDRLLDEDANLVADLQDQLDKSIQFQVDPLYNQEQYDVVFM